MEKEDFVYYLTKSLAGVGVFSFSPQDIKVKDKIAIKAKVNPLKNLFIIFSSFL